MTNITSKVLSILAAFTSYFFSEAFLNCCVLSEYYVNIAYCIQYNFTTFMFLYMHIHFVELYWFEVDRVHQLVMSFY